MLSICFVLRPDHGDAALIEVNPANRQETAVIYSNRTRSHGLKPRAIKRMRQSEAALRPQREPLRFPEPEPPVWKPLG